MLSATALRVIAAAYSSRDRHYHTLQHIIDMFGIAKSFDIKLTEEQTDAIWFHDIVYTPGLTTNEENSVNMAFGLLKDKDPQYLMTIRAIIMSTRDHMPTIEDSKIVIDLDLSILASDPENYDTYVNQVRLEYSHINDKMWNYGRSKFLRKLLDRPTIYLTDKFKSEFEEKARTNIIRELQKLEDKNELD